ncbi:DUF3455 domain-containing protein [Plastoroseomonas hellenica]|uniref:DUF3455 domain-containing protein n=1 Tax=Plastoroseomonas hellenica TaxID=2687306 RepID=UPI001BA97FFD|nr:DUF3455 domain-containing protein [Plastoroseomonas hellenica]
MDQTLNIAAAPAGAAGTTTPGSPAAAGQAPARPPVKRWVCVLGLLIAFGLGWGGWAVVQDHQRAATTGSEVEGRMTGGYREVTSRRGGRVVSTSYYPTFSYRTAEGRIALGTVSDAIERAEIGVGRTMLLRVVPGDPPTVRIAAELAAGPGAVPWVLGGLALALGIPSAIGLFRRRRAAPLPPAVALIALAWATAGNAQTPPAIPAPIAAPELAIVATLHAQGAQIYECRAGADGRLAWAFREPVATLLEGGRTVGRHYAGPSWELADGSIVTGRVTGRAPGRDAGDIPWLRLEVAERRGAGRLTPVSVIQRINTVGGVAEGDCPTAGALRSVPYASDYVFLAPRAN